MNIGRASDYLLSFQVEGISFLITDLSVRGYNGIDVLDTSNKGTFSQYFPLASCQRYAQEGLELYGDAQAFKAYLQCLEHTQNSCEALARGVLAHPTFSKQDLSRLFDGWLTLSKLYFRMGLEYTEAAINQTNNSVIAENLKLLETKKNPVRECVTKSFISDTSYLADILDLLAARFDVPKNDLGEYKLVELLSLFDGQKVEQKTIQDRLRAVVAQAKDGHFEYVWGDEAVRILSTFEQSATLNDNELRGTVANNKGIVRGRVTVISVNYQDFASMNKKMEQMPEGSILIAQTTAPELMVACKKAAAIVTDLGGLMSHAAIVSRELGIPCLVGTGRSTKIFKEGDLVEVDTEKGFVRKIGLS